ncbi:MAG: glutaredoxin domain-containing protein [Lactimicrobium sp.]|jgi:glutaredoxin-related protein|uniref:glutaredoxin domain-containing protein n=1 Tax=Lactimicrobium sp. TaxID=2563780 RepID=UPI002F35CDC5
MLKVYGSEHCPDCTACKASLDASGIAYDFVDITGSMPALKEFLAIRDTNSLYDEVRARHSVGIPTLVEEDGAMTLDWEGWMKAHNGKIVEPKAACSLDHKGNC